jgi:hypothetical protein
MSNRLTKAAIGIVALTAVGLGVYTVHVRSKHNWSASCANSRSFIHWKLSEYAEQHDGWYPKGGSDPLDSLAKCVGETNEVHFFTSHAHAQQLTAYWKKHGTFSSDLCCYRYVEGLRTNDPEGLVLLYYREPTRWECHTHKASQIGRPVCFLPPGHSWKFIPEQEFQEKLAQTLAYLEQQGRRAESEQRHGRAELNQPNFR